MNSKRQISLVLMMRLHIHIFRILRNSNDDCVTNSEKEKMMKSRFSMIVAASLCLVASSASAVECELYEHRDYGGAMIQMNEGEDISMEQADLCNSQVTCSPEWNDIISSFKTARGCSVTLWWDAEDVQPRGEARRFNGSYRYVGNHWNDEASWARCTCSG
jgi:syncollin